MKRTVLWVMAAAVTAACATNYVQWRPYPGIPKLEATVDVEIFDGKPSDIDYEELGEIIAANQYQDRLEASLKAQARRIGADAVIIMKRENKASLKTIRAIAVKFR